ncbi:MAG: beta-ketoacyl-ACP synthase II [Anaerolineae bacterium]
MHRVVVTGLGALCAVGNSAAESWRSVVEGRSGVGPITLFDHSDLEVKVAAEVKNFDPDEALGRREARRLDRFEQVALIAADEALKHSGLEVTDENTDCIGVAISSGVGGLTTLNEQILICNTEGPRKMSPFTIPRIMSNGASGAVSIRHGLRGPSFSTASACASAADGIGMSAHFIRSGMVNVMVAGGAECGITLVGVGSFDRVKAMSRRADNTPRPFSADRDGLVIGEGAAVLILESLEHAQARGATILAELIGYGASADAYHITAPTEDGSGSATAIKRAMEDARVTPEQIDYIYAHGSGTILNDSAETMALMLALGEQAYEIPTSSTKSMTGHMMGATGALEALFSVMAIRENTLPPTINYNEPDPESDLDYVPNEARDWDTSIVMSNSFGFGGHNSVLIFKEY